MKVGVSVKINSGKGDVLVKRRGRVYVLNDKTPRRKQRQVGPRVKRRTVCRIKRVRTKADV